MNSTARSLAWPGAMALAGGGVLLVFGLPAPLLTWALLTATHVVLLRTLPTPHLAAWLPLVALSAAVGADDSLPAVLLAALIGVALAGRPLQRGAACAATAGVPLAHAFAVASVGGLQVSPAFYFAAGAAAGATSFVLLGSAQRDKGLAILPEMSLAGAIAAGLGLLTATAGPLFAPLCTVGVLVAASGAFARREVEAAEAHTVGSLMRALEIKDLYTRGHSERVAGYARLIGAELGLDPVRLARLSVAGLLHDIGKVAVPRRLLRKRDRLADREYCEIQAHAPVAATLLEGIGFLEPVVPFVVEHHVHVDGGGYGTVGDDGPSLEARVLAVADAFDAMTTHRPYRRALTRAYAVAELRRCAGTQFDPDVVAALVHVLERSEFVPPAVGVESDIAARLAALGVPDIPEVISARL
ncbi:MAG TPA: HD domain-containing phosphohydrolase [Acidimicrobiia bacterium]|jgi:putative nucleotidyltransferase with HDIG domain|nr:HD domain-containing phosphohydrolase [Acidimicrobiia bacterium]